MAVTSPQGVAPSEAPEEITYEQYLRDFRVKISTSQPYEIIEGVRFDVNAPLLLHQQTMLNLAELFRRFQRQIGQGFTIASPFDVVITRKPKLQTRQPDLIFLDRQRLEQAGGLDMKGPLEIAPELVVEILSPSETPGILQEKIRDFRRIGVKECWVVRLDTRTVEVLRLTVQRSEVVAIYSMGQDVQSLTFSELVIPVAEIFAD